MKLKLPPRQAGYLCGKEFVRPDYDARQRALGMAGSGAFELPAERLPRLGEIVLQNPGIEILSDELHWFRREGATDVSAEQQNFKPDEKGYFQAPVSLAPALLRGIEAKWIGSERPAAEVHHADVSRGADDRTRPKVAENAIPERTGLPGKPTSWHLIDCECRRRYAEGERHTGKVRESRAEWARVLVVWLKTVHPEAPRVTEKTVTNRLPPLLSELQSER